MRRNLTVFFATTVLISWSPAGASQADCGEWKQSHRKVSLVSNTAEILKDVSVLFIGEIHSDSRARAAVYPTLFRAWMKMNASKRRCVFVEQPSDTVIFPEGALTPRAISESWVEQAANHYSPIRSRLSFYADRVLPSATVALEAKEAGIPVFGYDDEFKALMAVPMLSEIDAKFQHRNETMSMHLESGLSSGSCERAWVITGRSHYYKRAPDRKIVPVPDLLKASWSRQIIYVMSQSDYETQVTPPSGCAHSTGKIGDVQQIRGPLDARLFDFEQAQSLTQGVPVRLNEDSEILVIPNSNATAIRRANDISAGPKTKTSTLVREPLRSHATSPSDTVNSLICALPVLRA